MKNVYFLLMLQCLLFSLMDRALYDGQLDPSFGNDGIASSNFFTTCAQALDVLVQPDQKLVATGSYNCVNQTRSFVVARYLPDGTLDMSFNQQGWVTAPLTIAYKNPSASRVGFQSTHKIIVAGTLIQAGRKFLVVCFNEDGSLDKEFPSDTHHGYRVIILQGPNENTSLEGLLIQPDNKIVVAGTTTLNGRIGIGIARLTQDGMLDKEFNASGSAVNFIPDYTINGVSDVTLQEDGKIVVLGTASDRYHVNHFFLIRYGPNGHLDAVKTFPQNTELLIGDFGGPQSAGLCMALQPDQKIFIGGHAMYSPLTSTMAIARLLASGLFDPTWYDPDNSPKPGVVETWFDYTKIATPKDIVVQRTQKIIALATSLDNQIGIVRYWPNGTVDTTFSPFSNQPGKVIQAGTASGAALQKDDNLVITVYNLPGNRFSLARFIANTTQNESYKNTSDADGRF